MKVKLLKKIRKRFDWFINRKGLPILIDHQKENAFSIDDKVLLKFGGEKDMSEVQNTLQVSLEEYRWRVLKAIMLKRIDKDYGKVYYNMAIRLARTKNRSTNTLKKSAEAVFTEGVYNYLDCNILHVTSDDLRFLDQQSELRLNMTLIVYKKDSGYFVHVDIDDESWNEIVPELSSSLVTVLEKARKYNCYWLCLDDDGFIHSDLTCYNESTENNDNV